MAAVVHAEYVPFGRPATLALARALRELEGGDPLHPVTVVVPSNLAGLTARRLLAAGVGGESAGAGVTGVVNVSFVTPYQLAATLGGPAMARVGRLPLTGPVLHAAVRAALADHDGAFAPVARHVSTELAIARAYSELSRVSRASLDTLRTSPQARTRALVALVDEVRDRLGDYHDENDLVGAAISRAAEADMASTIGSIVVHLVDDLTPALAELLEALLARVPGRLVVGLTGDEHADRPAITVAGRLSPQSSGSVERELVSPATRLIEAPDTDEEVRAVIRDLAARVDAGLALDRVAILYPTPEPYLRILHDQLDAVGLPHNGPAGRPLTDSVVGRLVIRLLDQVQAGVEDPRRLLPRQGLIDLISAAPVCGADGRPVPATAFDLLSRRAGVIGGVSDWTDKLERYQANLAERRVREEQAESSVGRLAAIDREAADASALVDLVQQLADRLEPARLPATWRDRSRWLVELLGDLLPAEHRRQRWPDHEVAAAAEVVEVIERTAVLDRFDPAASIPSFARTVQSELDATVGRRGRFGQGVLLAPLVAVSGLDLDAVYLLGGNEGTLPPARREDSLLPDDERARTDDLPQRQARLARDRRDFLAALRVGADRAVLVHGSGDHRTGKSRLPSRWLLEVAGALTRGDDTPLMSSDWPSDMHHLHPLYPHLQQNRSFHEGVRRAPAPANLLDRDLASLVAHRESGQELRTHHLFESDAVLARGHELDQARRSPDFTRFDGNLAGVARTAVGADDVLSASRLETWASCPMRYFLGNELGLGDVERPEEIVELSALDRGSLVHLVLEDFLTPVVGAPAEQRPAPHDRWSEADRQRLLGIAAQRFSEFEDRGLTGKPLLWRIHRQQLLSDLEQWLDADSDLRAQLDAVPEAVEMRIGFEGQPPVSFSLSDGRELRFRGFADRVDRNRRDGTPVVIDYKTGKTNLTQDRLDQDPVQAGTKLQLGLYAEAARQRFGHTDAAAYYWYTSAAGEFRRLGYAYTPEREARFRQVVTTIVSGIQAGLFVTNSGDYQAFWNTHENCRWCDFDALCPRDRGTQSAAKQLDADAAAYQTLIDAQEST